MNSAILENVDGRPARPLAIALIVAMAAFLQMLDSSIINTALPAISLTFGIQPVDAGLGIIIYLLAAAIMIPTAAWVCDRFGSRRIFITSLIAFAISSLLCGLCSDLTSFVFARALQGATAALMGAVGQIILLRSIDRSEILPLMNISSIPMLVAPVLGPPLGGFLTEIAGWPWIFYISVPVSIILAVFAKRNLPDLPLKPRSFDVVGFILNAVSLSAFLVGLERFANAEERTGTTLLLILGVVVGCLAVRHLRRATSPLISLEPLRYMTFRLTTATALPLMRLPIGALLFVLPIQLQVVFGKTAMASGVVLLGHAAGDLLMKPLMTRTYRQFSYRTVLIVSSVVTAMLIGICGIFTENTSLTIITSIAFFAGASRSFMMTGLTTLAFDEVPQEQTSSAVALMQIVLQLAAAFSVALATIFFAGSAAMYNHGDLITPEDCRNVLWLLALIGLLAVPVLLRLHPRAGDRLSGRVSPP